MFINGNRICPRICFAGLMVFLLFSCTRETRGPSLLQEETILETPKTVLYISSYSPSVFTFDEQREGIRKRFQSQPVTLDAEFMDTKNFNTPENLENFKRSLLYKLEHGRQYDAVIVGDDNGLAYLMENKDELFPQTPVFFLGINNKELAQKSQEDPMVTGVLEAKSASRTIELAIGINPQAQRIVCLIDNTPSSQSEYQNLQSIKIKNTGLDLAAINSSEGSFEEFFEKISRLTETDLVLWIAAVTDKNGKTLTFDEMLNNLVRYLEPPIFGLTSNNIGQGVLGGCVVSHVDQGYAAADMAMQYFNGTPVSGIPFSDQSPNANVIDYQLLKKYGFSTESLPENTVYINKTFTFWEQYGRFILLGIMIMLFEFLIIFYLITNILVRRKTESALRENEKKFRSYIDNAPDGIFIFNAGGELVSANNSACRITGYPLAELLTLSMKDLLAQESVKAELYGQGSHELTYLTKSGQKGIWILDTVQLTEDRNLGFAKDITERRETQKIKRKLEKQLLQNQKMDAVGQLAGGVAHDFNNILGGIMGATQIIQSSLPVEDGENHQFLDMIMQASQRAADLNAKLLAFSRYGKVPSSVVDIHAVIEETLGILSQTIDKKIVITNERNAQNTRVKGDNTALETSLLNLCINASHAMPEGGDLLISTRNVYLNESYCTRNSYDIKPGEYIDIEIRDTGIGIPPENLSRIFEPFFTTKEKGRGTGLGLAAVYGTVQDHHGAISVYSEEGMGTIFHLILPCTGADLTKAPPAVPSQKGSGRILLVDDEEFIRITGQYTLEQMGYDVIQARDGSQGVEIYAEKHREIDLVILDMIMPRMNGREAFMKMKEINPQCKVVISSGFAKEKDLKEMKSLGLMGIIQKPYRTNELSALLTEVITK